MFRNGAKARLPVDLDGLIIYPKTVFNPNLAPDPMPISLDLSRHCIETELRRRHDREIAAALRPGADLDRSERRIARLRAALDGLDFPRLRTAHPELRARSAAEVTLVLSESGRRISLRVNGTPVASVPAREVP